MQHWHLKWLGSTVILKTNSVCTELIIPDMFIKACTMTVVLYVLHKLDVSNISSGVTSSPLGAL